MASFKIELKKVSAVGALLQKTAVNFRSNSFFELAIGWSLAFFSILGLLNFHPIVKSENELQYSLWWITPLFLLGIGLMVDGYRRISPRKVQDIGRRNAWICLAVILASGAFLRLYQADQAPGFYWDDWATIQIWVYNVLDKNKFFWMFPSDGIEPFVPYVVTAFQALLPDAVKDLVVRRLADTTIDMAALWILYLCGKELASRRTGLIAAGLGALGRPMIQLTVTGMRAFSLSLAVALLILASLKLFRKPTLLHFLFWGFALAFGVHTYSSFRCFMLITPFLMLPWVLSQKEERKPHPLTWLGFLGALFLLLGVYSGTLAGTDLWFGGWNDLWKNLTQDRNNAAAIFLLCLSPSIYRVWKSGREGRLDRLAAWSLALGSACFLIYPLTLSAQFDERLRALSPFRDAKVSGDIYSFFGMKILKTFRSLFYFCQDRNDLHIGTDPFFDLFSQGALLWGLAYFLAKPSWKKSFLLGMAALGTLVYVLSFDPASTKLIASAPILYLLAAEAIAYLWDLLPKGPMKRSRGFILTGIFAAYALWGGWIQFEKIYGVWAKQPGLDSFIARHLAHDEPYFRVYLAPYAYFFGWNSQAVLNEGQRYYALKDTNAVPVRKGKAPENIVVYVYGTDNPVIAALHRSFPKAFWVKMEALPPEDYLNKAESYVWRVAINGKSLKDDPGGILYRQEGDGPWLRRGYRIFFGWQTTAILREERVPRLSEPLPYVWIDPKWFGQPTLPQMTQSLGTLSVGSEGDYDWKICTRQPIWLKIDGETRFKRDTSVDEDETRFKCHLGKGIHQLEIRARFPYRYSVLKVQWKNVNEQEWKTL